LRLLGRLADYMGMHTDGLDGLHEVVREAARPYWIRDDRAEAVAAAWAAVVKARPAGDLWFVDPGAPEAAAVQASIETLLETMASVAPASEAIAAASPQAAFELLAALSLCARYVDEAVSADEVDRVVRGSLGLSVSDAPAVIDRLLSAASRAARPMIAQQLIDALTQSNPTDAAAGTRAVYLHIVESDPASAQAAAARCTELLRDQGRRRRTIAVLSPSVIDRLDAADRVVIPAVLALELQDGWLEGEHVVRGWAAIDAAQLLWDDFLPTARAQVVEAIGFGLQNGEPERQAYLARTVCTLAPLLVGRETADLTRGLARALVRRNAVDAADQVVAAAPKLPEEFRELLLGAMAVQQVNGPQDAATAARAALGKAHAAAAVRAS
jgi:hypothetical protein